MSFPLHLRCLPLPLPGDSCTVTLHLPCWTTTLHYQTLTFCFITTRWSFQISPLPLNNDASPFPFPYMLLRIFLSIVILFEFLKIIKIRFMWNASILYKICIILLKIYMRSWTFPRLENSPGRQSSRSLELANWKFLVIFIHGKTKIFYFTVIT